MKKHFIQYTATCLVIAITVLSFSACDKEPKEEDNVTLKQLTSGTWQMRNVTVDGTNQNALFTGLTLTFTPTGYTATEGEPVWPASGTWVFADAEKKIVKRDDGIDVMIMSISETELILTLTWNKTTFSGGRSRSIKGVHTFELGK